MGVTNNGSGYFSGSIIAGSGSKIGNFELIENSLYSKNFIISDEGIFVQNKKGIYFGLINPDNDPDIDTMDARNYASTIYEDSLYIYSDGVHINLGKDGLSIVDDSANKQGMVYLDTVDVNTIITRDTTVYNNIRTYGNINSLMPISYAESVEFHLSCLWADNNSHNLVMRGSNGLSAGIGWNGIVNNSDGTQTKYGTELNLRGQTVTAPNVGGATVTSDERLKHSFETLDIFDDVYMSLKPISFKYKNGKSGRKHFGFGAGQIKEALESNGFTTRDFAGFVQLNVQEDNEDYSGITDPMGLIYTEFTAWNTHMIQKLYKENEALKQEIKEIKEAIANK